MLTDSGFFVIVWTFIILGGSSFLRTMLLARRTAQRSACATAAIASFIVVATLLFIRSILFIMEGEYRTAGTAVAMTLAYLCLAIWIWHDDDNNWFKKQYTKLKKGFKNLQSSIQAAFMPKPATA